MRWCIPRISAVILVLSLVTGAASADIARGQETEHRVAGRIDSNALAGFMRQMKPALEAGEVTLLLDSPGGQMSAARLIADLMDYLSRRGVMVKTHIGPGARCLSACVLVYAAGRERTASATASIGLHAVWDAETGRIDPLAGRNMAGTLTGRGVERAWLDSLARDGVFDSRTMTAFTGRDLVKSGLAHTIRN